jgi:hypothetical protein
MTDWDGSDKQIAVSSLFAQFFTIVVYNICNRTIDHAC